MKLEAKFGARSGQVHQIREKTRRKSWGKKIPIWGSNLKFRGQNLGYLSPIFLETTFGAPTRISEANFGAKAPQRPPNMEVPPWDENSQSHCNAWIVLKILI